MIERTPFRVSARLRSKIERETVPNLLERQAGLWGGANMNGVITAKLNQIFSVRLIVVVFVAAFVAVFTLIPLFALIWNSFKEVGLGQLSDFSLTNFTLDNYIDAYIDSSAYTMMLNSFIFAFGSMVVGFLMGGSIAFLVERTNIPCKNLAYGLILIPLITPGILKAISWVLLLNPNIGLLNQLWFLLGFSSPLFHDESIFAMMWVQGISMVPITFLLFGAALKMMDPALEEAAYVSGAGKVRVFSGITLRLMMPAVAGVCLLTFIRALEAFDVPLIMGFGAGFQVFATNIYYSIRLVSPPEYGLAMAYSMLLVIIATVGLILYQRVMKYSYRYTTITGKGFRPRLIDLGKWKSVYAWGMFFSSPSPLFYPCWS